MSDSLSIIIILICLVLSGYFSATETALSTFNKTKIKTLAEKGNKKAQKVLDTSEKYDRMLRSHMVLYSQFFRHCVLGDYFLGNFN